MDHILTIISVLGLGALFSFLFSKKKKKEPEAPPKNTAADVARETVQQTFEEEVTGVFRAVESKDPAGALADRGNTRRRK